MAKDCTVGLENEPVVGPRKGEKLLWKNEKNATSLSTHDPHIMLVHF